MSTFELIIITILLLETILLIVFIYITCKNKNKDKSNIDFSSDLEKINNQLNGLNASINTINNNLSSTIQNANNNLMKSNSDTLLSIQKSFDEFKDKTNQYLDNKITQIDNKLSQNINDNFKNSRETFNEMIKSLETVKQAQYQLEKTQDDIVSLQNLLSDKKTRGNFGELQLETILYNIFGESNQNSVYQIQYKLPTQNGNFIADAILKCPQPLGTICIDSKFPLENYNRLINESKNSPLYSQYSKAFKADLKKHIDDISSKYIQEGITSSQAIMFLPSEAIFAEINANFYESIKYGQEHNIWITSPTTLMAFLTTVQTMLKNVKFSQNLDIIKENLKNLSKLFNNYKQRWDTLSKHIESVSNDVKDINITSEKISNNFNKIAEKKLLDD